MENLSRMYYLVQRTCEKAKHKKLDIIGALMCNGAA